MRTTRAALILAVAGILPCTVTTAWAGTDAVQVTEAGTRREARTTVDGCPVSIEVQDTQLRYRDECPRPQADKLASLAALVRALGGMPAATTSIGVGRLSPTFPDMARVVARAAARRPAAEIARGLGGPDHGNRLFVELADAADALAPLRAALVAQGVRPVAVSVEKVLRAPARETPFAAWLAAEGVPPDRVVPFDAQVWIRVDR